MTLITSPKPAPTLSTWRRMLVVGVVLIAIMAGLVTAFTLEAALTRVDKHAWTFHDASTEAQATQGRHQ